MTLRVLEPGLCTLVVDWGRPHSRSLGVPVGGAADRTALAIGNALVGNPPAAAALEFSLAGPTLQAECALACVVYGAPFSLQSDRQQLKVGTTFTLTAGEILTIGGTPEGMRGYLCVAGSIQEKMILDSRASLEPLKAGAGLPCSPGRIGRHFVKVEWQWDLQQLAHEAKLRQLGFPCEDRMIRYVKGPQAEWFPDDALSGIQDGWGGNYIYSITSASNRMGLRLQGPPLPVPKRELVSEPVCPGSIQVTSDGQCIILGMDGQTIGGYPKIGQVISADLDLLGQLRSGERVCFQCGSLAEAERLFRAKQAEVRAWVLRIRTAVSDW